MLNGGAIIKEACEKGEVGMINLDPRTHFVTLTLASILSVLVNDQLQVHLMVVASALYLVCLKLTKQMVYLVLLYIVFLSTVSFLPDIMTSLILIFYTFARMIPMIMIGTAFVHTPPSSILCAFERTFIFKPIIVMICILIRFFPVIVLEMKIIREGILARGIFPRWYSFLRHPTILYECFFLPLIVRCLKLSSELASSAELRGIGCKRGRTSINFVGMTAVDSVVIGGYVLISLAIYWVGVVGL
ncbi:energy-coupling factor transporter transmembrane component T family protein [Lysinibacillus sp. NPDC092081]|uniref:energy-coupling factor transporter transmembrane component T family protein n=1 Tax=Lysinibacillus sp. NPDC092081 TaxID=3364131 RepID=UPI00381C27E9